MIALIKLNKKEQAMNQMQQLEKKEVKDEDLLYS